MASLALRPRSPYHLLLLGCAVALFAESPVLHTQTGSRHPNTSVVVTSKPGPQETKVLQSEESLRAAQKAGASLDEQVAMLDVLVDMQRLLVKDPSSTDLHVRHLQALVEELATLKARVLTPRIAALRVAAEKALADGQFETAAETLRAALECQRTINQSPAPATAKDISGESTLASLLRQAEATPATNAVNRDLHSARQAAKDSRIEEATAAYTRAREAQVAINLRFAGTSFASQSLLSQIDVEAAAVQAEVPLREIRELVVQADLAASAGQIDTAANQLATALTKLRELAQHFPSAVAADEMDDLERTYQTVRSRPLIDAAAALNTRCDEALRIGDTRLAVTLARQALETLEIAQVKFPQSSRLEPTLIRKFTYIGLRENELASIRDQFREQLRPVPSHAGLHMQKAEVSQALYTQIMNANPSRNPGGPLPVDSVNWEEAATFCRRLSWLMGATVRLPTCDEWQAAVTGSENAPAWTVKNSNARTQETGKSAPGPTGFSDLTGNVAEWLQPASPASPEAPVAGGSFLDTADRIQQTPVSILDRTARNRYIGFRAVMEGR